MLAVLDGSVANVALPTIAAEFQASPSMSIWIVNAYQLAITARGVSLTAIEGLETAWNGDVAVTGQGIRGLVRGQAHLVRGTYTRDLSIMTMLLQENAGEHSMDWGREIALQLDLNLDDNLVVRSPQARLRAGGTLHLRGTVTHPVVLGTEGEQDGNHLAEHGVEVHDGAGLRRLASCGA